MDALDELVDRYGGPLGVDLPDLVWALGIVHGHCAGPDADTLVPLLHLAAHGDDAAPPLRHACTAAFRTN